VGEQFEVVGPPERLAALRAAAEKAGAKAAESDFVWEPKNTVPLGLEDARKVLAMVSELEDHDDVQSVTPNFEIPDEVLAALEREEDA